MKTSSSSLRSFPRIALATLAIVIVAALPVPSARALLITLQQVGPNVVATGSGAFDLTGLTFVITSAAAGARMIPSSAGLVMGPPPTGWFADVYSGAIGPANFGSGGLTTASSGSGANFYLQGFNGRLGVPTGYVSGTALLSSSMYNNATFASLGVTPGTYVWSWGTGANQNFTLQIGAAVPESGSSIALLFLSLGALLGASRLRSLRFG